MLGRSHVKNRIKYTVSLLHRMHGKRAARSFEPACPPLAQTCGHQVHPFPHQCGLCNKWLWAHCMVDPVRRDLGPPACFGCARTDQRYATAAVEAFRTLNTNDLFSFHLDGSSFALGGAVRFDAGVPEVQTTLTEDEFCSRIWLVDRSRTSVRLNHAETGTPHKGWYVGLDLGLAFYGPELNRKFSTSPADPHFVTYPDVCIRTSCRVHVSLAYLPALNRETVIDLIEALNRRLHDLREVRGYMPEKRAEAPRLGKSWTCKF